MTIFDVLRYPISRPPTNEQIEALPQEVYTKWCKVIGFTTIIPEKKFVAGILRIPTEDDPYEDECYAILRKLLEEYNPNDTV